MKWLLLMGLAAAGVASWQFLPGAVKPPADAPSSSATDHATPSGGVQAVGHVEPVSEVRKLMMRTGGVVKRCRFRVGEPVRKGETIMELEDATQRADAEVARRNVALARAEADRINAGTNPYKIKVAEETVKRLREKVRYGRTEAGRYNRMIALRAASPQERESIETQFRQGEIELREQEAELLHLRMVVTPEQKEMAEAKVRHAQAGLELAEERMRETRLLAPFDGTVLKYLKREGEGMSTLIPEPVAAFGDTSRLRVRAEVDERFVRRLAVGQSATVFGRNVAGESHAGRVVQIEQIMGDKTAFTRSSSERKDLNVVQVVIDMDPAFRSPAGLQVDVRIETDAEARGR